MKILICLLALPCAKKAEEEYGRLLERQGIATVAFGTTKEEVREGLRTVLQRKSEVEKVIIFFHEGFAFEEATKKFASDKGVSYQAVFDLESPATSPVEFGTYIAECIQAVALGNPDRAPRATKKSPTQDIQVTEESETPLNYGDLTMNSKATSSVATSDQGETPLNYGDLSAPSGFVPSRREQDISPMIDLAAPEVFPDISSPEPSLPPLPDLDMSEDDDEDENPPAPAPLTPRGEDLESISGGLDDGETAPYKKSLTPSEREAQERFEEQNREVGMSPPLRSFSQGKAEVIYVTSAAGGLGKTSHTWLMASLLAYLYGKEPNGMPVYLIEADYSNPKLADRLALEPDRSSGYYARELERMSAQHGISITQMKTRRERALDKSTYVDKETGLRIIAAPYKLTSDDDARRGVTSTRASATRRAIKDIVEQVRETKCVIFLDGSTLDSYDALQSALASESHHVILIGDSNHIGDIQRAYDTAIGPKKKSGLGVLRERVTLLLNFTNKEKFDRIAEDPNHALSSMNLCGFMPDIKEIAPGSNDEKVGAWVGNLSEVNKQVSDNMLVRTAMNLSNVSPHEVLKKHIQTRPLTTTKDKGVSFLGRFKRSRR